MRFGEIWRYRPVMQRPRQSNLRLILSGNDFTEDAARKMVMGAHLVEWDPGDLLNVEIAPHGWLSLVTHEPVLRSRLDERVGTATPEQLDAVRVAMRALYPDLLG